MKDNEISLDELCPYVRKVGLQNSKQWKNKQRKLYDYEMFYVAEGKANIKIENNILIMDKGKIIIVPPDTSHSFWINDDEKPIIYWVHFDFKYRHDVHSLDKLVTEHNSILYSEKLINENYIRSKVQYIDGFDLTNSIMINNKEIESYFKELFNIYEKHNLLWQIDSKILFLKIFKCIFDELMEEFSIKYKYKKSASDVVIEYIHNNYNRKITLRELAEQVAISEDYLGKMFKKNTGKTIIEYLNNYRISKAKEFLMDLRLSIEDIAEMTGFSDIYYFSKVMKKIEGVSPSRWRNTHLS